MSKKAKKEIVRNKIKIKLSKKLVRDAAVRASNQASKNEIRRQTCLQIQGTHVENISIGVVGQALFVEPNVDARWPTPPDTEDLTFQWIE